MNVCEYKVVFTKLVVNSRVIDACDYDIVFL